jgi:hypothetical protein
LSIIGYLESGDWAGYGPVNFANGTVTKFTARIAVADGWEGKQIQVRLGSPTGQLVGRLTTRSTGGWDKHQEQTTTLLAPVTGVHTLYLVFDGGDGGATIDSFRFS